MVIVLVVDMFALVLMYDFMCKEVEENLELFDKHGGANNKLMHGGYVWKVLEKNLALFLQA